MGSSLQEQTAPARVTHRVTGAAETWSCQQTAAPAWRVLHHGVSWSYSFLQEISSTVACSPWWTAGSISAALWTSMGQLALQTTLPQAAWESPLQLWSTSSPSFCIDLELCRVASSVPHSIFTVSSMCYQRGAASIAEGWWIYFGATQS